MKFQLIVQLIVLVIHIARNPYIFFEILRAVKHRKFIYNVFLSVSGRKLEPGSVHRQST